MESCSDEHTASTSHEAVIVVVPSARPVASPAASMIATEAFEDDQTTFGSLVGGGTVREVGEDPELHVVTDGDRGIAGCDRD